MKLMEPLAHSAKPDRNVSEQSYAEHVANVLRYANDNTVRAGRYWKGGGKRLMQVVCLASEFHDLGKLDEANQAVLRDGSSKHPLPINHVDAGVAAVLSSPYSNGSAALLVNAHHAGLPDIPNEYVNARSSLRDRKSTYTGKSLMKYTDENLSLYRRVHYEALKTSLPTSEVHPNGALLDRNALLSRIALSCLVDADHYDTARNYNDTLPSEGAPLNPAERLRLLDAHIEYLSRTQQGDRTALRNSVYQVCRDAAITDGMFACDSPVGTGKTTAVMAHLLKAAANKGLRRIFIVLPFTNIIDQSVEVYRRALVGLGEDPSAIVAAHHHRAEFESAELRQYSFLWHAPIVVTTAVQFFETLASNRPASLRKLHQLVGSAIFIDEAHAALPAHLWPQAWKWLKDLSNNWSCHFVLGSGSLNRFWQLEEFEDPPIELPELVAADVRKDTLDYEDRRIGYLSHLEPLNMEELCGWLDQLPGPRLLIVNTVQSAAVIADSIRETRGRTRVEHLSTSLSPSDRKKTLDNVKKRLSDQKDEDWTLVATSCVEAGVDLSFRTGLRERCSLNGLIQIGGRVNRKGEYGTAEVWDFQLRCNGLLTSHRAFDTSSRIVGELFSEKQVRPEFATEAMRREIRQTGLKSISEEILKCERNLKFPDVTEKFKVIDSNTITAVVDERLKARLGSHAKVSPDEIQNGSVQIWASKVDQYGLQPLQGHPDLWQWNLRYDDFIGYMAGALEVRRHENIGTII